MGDVATEQTRFRQPEAERLALMGRAERVHQSNLSEVCRALALAYVAGELDPVVTSWLVRLPKGASIGTQQPSGQEPPASG